MTQIVSFSNRLYFFCSQHHILLSQNLSTTWTLENEYTFHVKKKNEKPWILKTVYGKHALYFSDFFLTCTKICIFWSSKLVRKTAWRFWALTETNIELTLHEFFQSILNRLRTMRHTQNLVYTQMHYTDFRTKRDSTIIQRCSAVIREVELLIIISFYTLIGCNLHKCTNLASFESFEWNQLEIIGLLQASHIILKMKLK